jgi:uncharacterized membrane protein YkoI
MNYKVITAAAVLAVVGAGSVQAQTTSDQRIRIHKDVSAGEVGPMAVTDTGMVMDTLTMDWYRPSGNTCASVDVSAAREVSIKTDMYDASTMISPDSAKVIALCAVPGQIGSGEMNMSNGRAEYAIDIIPNQKKTHTKVIVDANTGAVLSSKQFGGLRGLAGWVRESFEHKQNKKP